ncbi:MAG: S-layer homology domain-containing protein [Clostridia bacterium]|nr:S-layer homology domain-containing protein [Clostridia bacterium]
MKKLLITFITIAVLICTVTSAGASLLSPGLLILSEDDPMIMSGVIGKPISFSSEDFCNHAGVDSYSAVTLNSVPSKSEGVLTIDENTLGENHKISFSDSDRLVFTPAEGVCESSFTFTVGDGCTAKCTVILTDELNLAPTASSALTAIDTFSGMSISGHMIASDPEGDKLIYEVTDKPELGEISYNKDTGSFTYTSDKTGNDSFTFRVKDSYGNYSEKASVSLNISNNTTGITFSDMKDNGAYAAAVLMTDEGIFTSKEESGNVFFEPSENVSRLDFLVCTMNALGAANLPQVSSTGFHDDDNIPENAKSYVYSAAKLGIINGKKDADGNLYFDADGAITRAEAAVILNNIIGYTAQCSYNTDEKLPVWAEDSLYAMHELGILSASSPDAPLTKADCASLLYGLTSLI